MKATIRYSILKAHAEFSLPGYRGFEPQFVHVLLILWPLEGLELVMVNMSSFLTYDSLSHEYLTIAMLKRTRRLCDNKHEATSHHSSRTEQIPGKGYPHQRLPRRRPQKKSSFCNQFMKCQLNKPLAAISLSLYTMLCKSITKSHCFCFFRRKPFAIPEKTRHSKEITQKCSSTSCE